MSEEVCTHLHFFIWRNENKCKNTAKTKEFRLIETHENKSKAKGG